MNIFKSSLFILCAATLAYVPGVVEGKEATSCHEKTCNGDKHHPEKFVGAYYRSDTTTLPDVQSRPMFILNENGVAESFDNIALYQYVTSGEVAPGFGNWQHIGKNQVLVMTLGTSAAEDPFKYTANDPNCPASVYVVTRDTWILDFSKSLNSPQIIARSSVFFPADAPSALYLDPNAGTVLYNDPIEPRQLQRICAFASDLDRLVPPQVP